MERCIKLPQDGNSTQSGVKYYMFVVHSQLCQTKQTKQEWCKKEACRLAKEDVKEPGQKTQSNVPKEIGNAQLKI